MSAVLLDPLGCEPIVIEENEHQQLKTHLEIMRDDTDARARMYKAIAYSAVSGLEKDRIQGNTGERNPLTGVMFQLCGDNLIDPIEGVGHPHGAIVPEVGQPDFITEREIETLRYALVALRAGGWFASWLWLQLKSIASSTEPDVRYPSPMKIMGTLVNDIEQYECNEEIAREMVEMRPDLFLPKPAPKKAASPRRGSASHRGSRSKRTAA